MYVDIVLNGPDSYGTTGMQARNKPVNIKLLLLLVACLAWCLILVNADALPPSPPTTPLDSTQSNKLGKINVKGMQHLVKTLQQVKVALHTPFSDNPKLVDQMVCELGTNQPGHRNAAVLECGTQGWYSMRRESNQLAWLTGQAAIPARGHPWHTVRVLDHAQLLYLRKLLKVLPPPASDVQVIEDLGKDTGNKN